ncbi:unnamed protein product [Polarella glacialis]|uniref:YHYH domain-containing protein n=1 Tax=Polarella glacialis TaxID=89957 RepID=A0A813E7T4_POLGL|nr:unnamed protein product [Polarella glacialis]
MVHRGLCVSVLSAVLSALPTTFAAFSTASCDNLASCSPAECSTNTEGNCVFDIPSVDFAAAVQGLSCRSTCTQSTSAEVCTGLASKLKTDGHVKAAWCTEDFLVIVSDGKPSYDADSDSYLGGIPLPPGGGANCRARSAAEQLLVFKVPLAPQKLASGASNTMTNPLDGVAGMPEAGATAVAIDGVPIFPNYNNRGLFAFVSCEVDRCNAHAGTGADYHYHGDPFGAKCLYGESNYSSSAAHPPLIAFALDGFLVYGRHTAASQEGQSYELDACGGHTHTSYAYHYHPEVRAKTTTSLDGTVVTGTVSYTAYLGAPMECWAGDISKISNFWQTDGRQVNYDSTKDGLAGRNDYEQLRPCCNMTNYFAAPGIVVNTVAGSAASPTPSPTASSSSDSGTCSGTDDKGQSCPPSYDASRPCPPGCTSVPSSGSSSPTPSPSTTTAAPSPSSPSPSTSSIAFSYTTSNALSYMCASGTSTSGRSFACGQGQYPAGLNDGINASISCDTGTIECFLFASMGEVGGRCINGDAFKENPNNEWAYMPASVGTACVGQSSCVVTMGVGTLNSVASSPATAWRESNMFKALALCSAGSVSPTPTTTAAPSANPTATPTTPTATPTPTQAPTVQAQKITGSFIMQVSDPAAFAADPKVKTGVAKGLANLLGVPSSNIVVELACSESKFVVIDWLFSFCFVAVICDLNHAIWPC